MGWCACGYIYQGNYKKDEWTGRNAGISLALIFIFYLCERLSSASSQDGP